MVRKISEDKTKPEIQIALERFVDQMRQKAEVSTGECVVCHKEGKLLSGVCEVDFVTWATEAAKSQMRWRGK